MVIKEAMVNYMGEEGLVAQFAEQILTDGEWLILTRGPEITFILKGRVVTITRRDADTRCDAEGC